MHRVAKRRGACANRSIKPVAPTGETAIGGDRGVSASGRRWRRRLGRPGQGTWLMRGKERRRRGPMWCVAFAPAPTYHVVVGDHASHAVSVKTIDRDQFHFNAKLKLASLQRYIYMLELLPGFNFLGMHFLCCMNNDLSGNWLPSS